MLYARTIHASIPKEALAHSCEQLHRKVTSVHFDKLARMQAAAGYIGQYFLVILYISIDIHIYIYIYTTSTFI